MTKRFDPLSRTIGKMTEAATLPKKSFLFLLAFASLLKLVSSSDDGHCIWYGECYTDEFGHKKNCPYTGPPKPLDMPGQKLLSKWCPHLLDVNATGILTCCDVNQLQTFDANVQLTVTFLKRCPSCLNNFLQYICEITCSSMQSTFINVTSIERVPDTNVSYVNEIDVFITNRYIDGTFNSCKEVSVPSLGKLALDLICGEYTARKCSAQRWFQFMGDAENNPYVPFQITFINTDGPIQGFVPIDPQIQLSTETLNVSSGLQHAALSKEKSEESSVD